MTCKSLTAKIEKALAEAKVKGQPDVVTVLGALLEFVTAADRYIKRAPRQLKRYRAGKVREMVDEMNATLAEKFPHRTHAE